MCRVARRPFIFPQNLPSIEELAQLTRCCSLFAPFLARLRRMCDGYNHTARPYCWLRFGEQISLQIKGDQDEIERVRWQQSLATEKWLASRRHADPV